MVTETRVKVTSVYDRLFEAKTPIVVCMGGSDSSKSYSMAQLVIWLLANERNITIGVGRKTLPSLRLTAYPLIIGLAKEYGIYSYGHHNKTELSFKYGTNTLQFFGIDDPERKKSFLANFLWLEEANEFSKDDVFVLRLCLKLDPGRMFLTFNPVESWIFDTYENNPDATWIHSTYKDNPFVKSHFVDMLEALKDQDLNYYNIYALGQRGKLEDLIYPNWQLIDEMPYDFEQEVYGVDFGFENPTVIAHVGITGDKLFIDELLYETHLTNADLITHLKGLPALSIFADSAEPQRIEEITRARLACYPAVKNVSLGIDMVKRHKIHLTKRSVHGIQEIQTYRRKKDKNGHLLDEPVKFRDHLLDALRYAVMGRKTEPERIVIYDAMQLIHGIDF